MHIILDTDLGSDIDDHWALGMLLNTPGAQLDMVLTATSDTEYRAALAAKFLAVCGRNDIPVGVGVPFPDGRIVETLRDFLGKYTIADAQCPVVHDGVEEAIRIIERNDETAIIAIAPMTNLGRIVTERPDLAAKCRLFSMAGSIEKNFRDAPGKIAEYNVAIDASASQKVFAADWKSHAITPLDHCGNIVMDGAPYQQLLHSERTIPREIIQTYRAWQKFCRNDDNPDLASSILYDTVAVFLATDGHGVKFTDMTLSVNDQGYLQNTHYGKHVRVAMGWDDKSAYMRNLAGILMR